MVIERLRIHPDKRETLMTPLTDDVLSSKEMTYNRCHKKCRCCVERAIGLLKSRFRCLCKQSGGGIQYNERTCCFIITSCVVLHNYCRLRNISHDVYPVVQAAVRAEANINRLAVDPKDCEQVKGIRARQAVIDSF